MMIIEFNQLRVIQIHPGPKPKCCDSSLQLPLSVIIIHKCESVPHHQNETFSHPFPFLSHIQFTVVCHQTVPWRDETPLFFFFSVLPLILQRKEKCASAFSSTVYSTLCPIVELNLVFFSYSSPLLALLVGPLKRPDRRLSFLFNLGTDLVGSWDILHLYCYCLSSSSSSLFSVLSSRHVYIYLLYALVVVLKIYFWLPFSFSLSCFDELKFTSDATVCCNFHYVIKYMKNIL